MKNLFCFLLILFTSKMLYAQPGTLDVSFGEDGFVSTDGGFTEGYGYSVAAQSDGRYVVGGWLQKFNSDDFLLMRFNVNGSLDLSFGDNGKVVTDLLQSVEVIQQIAIQADDKIVAAGSGSGKFTVLRYNSNGVLDSSFGGTGYLQFNGDATSVLIQPDGKIVAAGYVESGGYPDFVISRFNIDGSADLTFGSDGWCTTDLGNGAVIVDIALLPDGKILAAGNIYTDLETHYVVARYQTDGSLDSSFNDTGVKIVSLSSDYQQCYAMTIQQDGKILLAGHLFNGSNDDIGIARLNANGAIDNSFGSDGERILSIGSFNEYCFGISLQNDGKIIVTGSAELGNQTDLVVSRLLSNGTVDSTFADNGLLTKDFTGGGDVAMGILIQTDNKIVVTGFSEEVALFKLVILRLNEDGSPDLSFDGDGYVTEAGCLSHDSATDILVQPDGRILVSGYSTLIDFTCLVLVRYLPDGSRDSTWGGTGIVTNLTAMVDVFEGALALQSDGKILVGARKGWNSLAILRFNPDGTPDSTFDEDGLVEMINFTGVENHDIAVQNSGKILFTAFGLYNNSDGMNVIRFNYDGTLDSTFNSDGIYQTYFGNWKDHPVKMVIQDDDKIVVGGMVNYIIVFNIDLGILRLTENGEADSTFDGDGKLVYEPLGISGSYGGICVQPDKKIIATMFNDLLNGYLVRFNFDGTIDTSFGNNGIATVEIPSTYGYFHEVLLQPDGKIIAGGIFYDSFLKNTIITRFFPDGNIDHSFGNDGIATINTNSNSYSFASMALQPDQKILGLKDQPYDIGLDLLSFRLLNDFAVGMESHNISLQYLYPNPVHDYAVFEYELPQSSTVTLRLIDANGHIVYEFLKAQKSKGKHTGDLNFSNFSAGIYFLQLTSKALIGQAKENVSTVKIIRQ